MEHHGCLFSATYENNKAACDRVIGNQHTRNSRRESHDTSLHCKMQVLPMMKTERDHEFSPGPKPRSNHKTNKREERQMKKPAMTALVLGVFMQLATGARAQDTPVVDVATGYSFFYVVKA